MTGATCVAKLRDASPCRSVATDGAFCAYHAAMADQLGPETVVNGDEQKRRNARQRAPVVAESEPLELKATPGAPSGGGPDGFFPRSDHHLPMATIPQENLQAGGHRFEPVRSTWKPLEIAGFLFLG